MPPVDREAFKATLRRWASGVTIVTARSSGRMLGMTVSAFSSVSADPPLVLVCADKGSHTHPVIAAAGAFAVNVLAADQQEISNRFATDGNEAVRFEGLELREGPTGSPWLPGSHAVLDCRVVAAHDAGDHVVYIGEVLATELGGGEPLVHYDAHYRALQPR